MTLEEIAHRLTLNPRDTVLLYSLIAEAKRENLLNDLILPLDPRKLASDVQNYLSNFDHFQKYTIYYSGFRITTEQRSTYDHRRNFSFPPIFSEGNIDFLVFNEKTFGSFYLSLAFKTVANERTIGESEADYTDPAIIQKIAEKWMDYIIRLRY